MLKNAFTCLSNWMLAAGAAGVLVVCGCGKGAAPAVQTEMVEGVVTLDGVPVADATVTFMPVDEGAGASATGVTDSEGKYTLTAIGAGSGAKAGAGTLPGEYDVGVIKVEFPQSAASEADPSGSEPFEEIEEAEATHIIPERYVNPKESGIKATVKPGVNTIPIELKSK